MKVILIENSCPDTRALGVRNLSAFLESRGHTCRLVFIPPVVERMSTGVRGLPRYSQKLMDNLIDICRDADVVGISLLSYYLDLGIQVTREIQNRLQIPVIWGGYHAMGKIEGSLKYADYVCIGEGEWMFADLLDEWSRGGDALNTPNLAYVKNGQVVQNPVRPLCQDLDILPFLDYRLDTHFVLDPNTDSFISLDRTAAIQLSRMGPLSRLDKFHHYQTFMSRGCPYNCSYCCESTVHKIYARQKQVRRRSPENLAAEIQHVLKESDFITAIAFSDDSFSEAGDAEIEKFAEVYKREIDLPFSAQFIPASLSQRKLDALIYAGLKYVELGIQTGSEKTKKLFRRNVPTDKILKTCEMLNAAIGKILPPDYHFIVDNPWETTEDLAATLDLILKLPKPRGIKVSSLVFYPGTELYNKALSENRFHPDDETVFKKNFGALSPTPANLLFFLADFQRVPNSFIKFCMKTGMLNWKGKLIGKIVKIAVSGLLLSRRISGKIHRMLSGNS